MSAQENEVHPQSPIPKAYKPENEVHPQSLVPRHTVSLHKGILGVILHIIKVSHLLKKG